MPATDTYIISQKLVNALIISIFGSLLGIAGYMVIWAQTDSAFKADLMARIVFIERDVGSVKTKVDGGILPLAHERIENISGRLREVEKKVNLLEHDRRKYGDAD